jgi:hypothetical protein
MDREQDVALRVVIELVNREWWREPAPAATVEGLETWRRVLTDVVLPLAAHASETIQCGYFLTATGFHREGVG